MSQAKVDRYKEEKRNRAKIIKKQKMQWMLTKTCMSVVALAVVVWVGVSVYTGFGTTDTTADKVTYTLNTSAIDDFMSDLTLEEE